MLTTNASVASNKWRTTAEPINPAPPVTNTTALRNPMDQRPIGRSSVVRDQTAAPTALRPPAGAGEGALARRPAAPGDEPLVLESRIALPVAQRRTVEAEHAAAGGIQDGMTGGRIPF